MWSNQFSFESVFEEIITENLNQILEGCLRTNFLGT